MSARPGFLATARPAAALAAVWLTTAGHTAAFHEMNAARGWISSVGYSLHSAYLATIALGVLAAPALARRASSLALTAAGLLLLSAGSFLNGLLLHAPMDVLVGGRVLAGFGVGLVLFAGPRLLPAARGTWFDWFAVILPSTGLLLVARVGLAYGWSNWEGGFLFEGLLALFGLACVLPLDPPPEPPVHAHAPLAYWPFLAAAAACAWYLLHWGHLNGWWHDRTTLLLGAAGAACAAAALWLVWDGLDSEVVAGSWSRLALVAFAGLMQFFNAFDAGVSGGLFINLSEWQRAVLIWPIPAGAALALALGLVLPKPVIARRGVAAAGLLALTVGYGYAWRVWTDWPFWSVLNPLEFQWFAAPQAWELAPARFLMGLGHGLVILAETNRADPVPAREARIRPGLNAAQFAGGAAGIGVLATALVAGHQWEYAYASDRGDIQAVVVAERTQRLSEAYAAAGAAGPDRKAEVLMFRSVNYQADAMVFADLYAGFGVASGVMFAAVVAGMAWGRFSRPRPSA